MGDTFFSRRFETVDDTDLVALRMRTRRYGHGYCGAHGQKTHLSDQTAIHFFSSKGPGEMYIGTEAHYKSVCAAGGA
jgi:hypothetical protein